MNEIEKWIQFAIDNWYIITTKTWLPTDSAGVCWINEEDNVCIEYKRNKSTGHVFINLYKLITSKEFIEAMARWIYNSWDIISKDGLIINHIIETSIWESFYKRDWTKYIWRLENRITKEQAIAIRENELEEFIINILPWQKQ